MFGLDPQVHITVLAERLTEATGRPWSTADVRAAVGAAGGRVDTGVRMPGLNRPPESAGAHSPTPLRPLPHPCRGVVVAGQTV
ncbi:hypothetical protein CP979_36110 [Streptomyces filamentosus]|nr:hypothetical protein CP979_36110 [Streptomyces filamentosus]